MTELEHLLKNVSDSYSDFVEGTLSLIKKYYPEREADLISFLKSNPGAESSDVIEWIGIHVRGIDYDNPPELVLVDDDEE